MPLTKRFSSLDKLIASASATILFALFAILVPIFHASAAATVDGASGIASVGKVSNLIWSHTVSSGSDRMLIVGVSIRKNAVSVSNITYGGTGGFTLIGTQIDGGADHRVELWYKLAPDVGTANIEVTLNGPQEVVGGAVSFFGVDQSAPLGAFAGAQGTSANPSIDVPSADGEMIIDILSASGDSGAVTVGGGQTERWSGNTGTGDGNEFGSGSTELGASSVTMSWTLTNANKWAIGAVSVKPAAAPSTGDGGTEASLRPRDVIPSEIEFSILPEGCTTDRNVKLLLHAQDTAEVKIGSLPDLSDGKWQSFEPGADRTQTIDWTLPEGDGEKTVYVIFKGPFFDLVSPIYAATVRLDQANLCQTPVEHAHIVGLGGEITTTETDPDCLSDYGHAIVEPYIVDTDGITRGQGDLYAQVTNISDTSTVYSFETGSDFTYGDVVVHVERIGNSVGVRIDPIVGEPPKEVRVRILAADRGEIDDQLLWSLWNRDEPTETKEIRLEDYSQLCQSGSVPHPHPGDLFQSSSSDVYYYGKDLMRHVFPNEDVLKNWYPEGASIMTVASYFLPSIPLGTNVTLRPGTLARITNEPAIFSVGFHNQLRSFVTESLVSLFYGLNWGLFVHDLSAALVTNYVFGPSILSGSESIATPETSATSTIDDLWPVVAEEGLDATQGHAHTASVLDGRVEFEGAPYHDTGNIDITFRILAKDGHPFTAKDLGVEFGSRLYLILVRDDLSEFFHLHPEEQDGLWTVYADIPEEGGVYYAYIDIAPIGGERVILRSTLAIGIDPVLGNKVPEPSLNAAAFDNPFRLSLVPEKLVAGEDIPLEFLLTKDGIPFNDIEPWPAPDGPYGHIVILNQKDLNVYVHGHAFDPPDQGKITFTGTRFPFPGRYTLFVDLSMEGSVHAFPITIDVATSTMSTP